MILLFILDIGEEAPVYDEPIITQKVSNCMCTHTQTL